MFTGRSKAVLLLWIICVIYVLRLSCIAALWSPAWKGLTSWLLFVMFNCTFVTFPCGILGHVWYLIVSIPDLCRLSYFTCLFITRDCSCSLSLPHGAVCRSFMYDCVFFWSCSLTFVLSYFMSWTYLVLP